MGGVLRRAGIQSRAVFPLLALRALCIFCFLSFALCLLTACSRSDPQAALSEAADELQAALEAKDANRVLDLLHEDFAAQSPEEKGQEWARRTMTLAFTRYKNISIMVINQKNHINTQHPDRASSEAEVTLVGAEGLIPDSARRYHVQLGWIKVDEKWKLLRLEWK
jgi:ketosteroid isomerase-like protein